MVGNCLDFFYPNKGYFVKILKSGSCSNMILIMVVCLHPRLITADRLLLVSAKGLEPLTNGLKGHCSTKSNVLTCNKFEIHLILKKEKLL